MISGPARILARGIVAGSVFAVALTVGTGSIPVNRKRLKGLCGSMVGSLPHVFVGACLARFYSIVHMRRAISSPSRLPAPGFRAREGVHRWERRVLVLD